MHTPVSSSQRPARFRRFLPSDRLRSFAPVATCQRNRLLTLPDNWDNSDTNRQLMETVAYADKKNLRVERSSRNGKSVLVGTPLPTEASSRPSSASRRKGSSHRRKSLAPPESAASSAHRSQSRYSHRRRKSAHRFAAACLSHHSRWRSNRNFERPTPVVGNRLGSLRQERQMLRRVGSKGILVLHHAGERRRRQESSRFRSPPGRRRRNGVSRSCRDSARHTDERQPITIQVSFTRKSKAR